MNTFYKQCEGGFFNAVDRVWSISSERRLNPMTSRRSFRDRPGSAKFWLALISKILDPLEGQER